MRFETYQDQVAFMLKDYRCVCYLGMVSYDNDFGPQALTASRTIFDYWNLDRY